MPYFYDVVRDSTTDGSAGTEEFHLLFITAANQGVFRMTGLYGSVRSTTAGGARLVVKTAATPGSGGTSQTPAKRNSRSPAAAVAVTNDATALTPGTTLTNRLGVGTAQTGSPGGWVALTPDAALTLQPNGGANGNMEVYSNAASNSMPIMVTVEFSEE